MKQTILFTLLTLLTVFGGAVGAEETTLFAPAEGFRPATIQKGQTLDLAKCIEVALDHQPNIVAAQSAKLAAQSRLGQAKSVYYPKVDLNAGYSQTNPTPSPVVRSTAGRYEQFTAGVTLTQTLYDFGKSFALLDVQHYAVESAEADEESVRLNIVYGVKAAYYGYLQARRNAAVGTETVSQLKEHLEQAKAFFAAGTRPKYDVTKAEVDLNNAATALLHAENAVRLARLNLDNAIGMPGAPDYNVVDNLEFHKSEIGMEDAVTHAYRTRPDIRSASAKTKGARESVTYAQKGYYPTLSGSAQYNKAGTGMPLDDGWNVGIALTVPLFSGFSTDYQVRESMANYSGSVSAEEQLRQNVYYEVQQAYLNLKEAEDRIPASEKSMKLARENLDIANGRYTAGVGAPIEVTDAQITFSNAETSYIQSLSDYKVAQAALEKAIGGNQ